MSSLPCEVRDLIASAGERGKKASQRLFCLFMLEKWLRFYVDGDGGGRKLAQGYDLGLPTRGPAPVTVSGAEPLV